MEIAYNTLSEFMYALFGEYNPIGYEDASGSFIVAPGLAGVDWPYILSVCMFLLVVYCLFRLLWGVLWKS